MKTSEKILLALVIIMAISTAYFATQYFLSIKQLKQVNETVKAQQVNEKTLAFANLFIDKVLSGQTEVSFEDRLQLENSVRDLNDQEVFDQWQVFVKSGVGNEGQQNLTKLLKLLITKISY